MAWLPRRHDNVALQFLVSSLTWQATSLTNADQDRISILLSKVGQTLDLVRAKES